MQKFSLEALGRELLERAATAGGGRTAETVVGGHELALRQTVVATVKDSTLGDHESPEQATVYVLRGRVRFTAGTSSIELAAADFLPIPRERHSVDALEDAVLLLSVVK